MDPPPVNEAESTTNREAAPLRLVVAAEPQRPRSRRIPDRRRLVAGSILAVASVCLAVRIAAETKDGREALDFGQGILKAVRSGSGFYWFVWSAMVGGLVPIIAARRLERQERNGAPPGGIRDQPDWRRRRTGGRSACRVVRLLPGEMARSTRPRRRWASILVARGSVPILVLSATILFLTVPVHEPPVRWVLWAYAAIGTTLGIRAVVRG